MYAGLFLVCLLVNAAVGSVGGKKRDNTIGLEKIKRSLYDSIKIVDEIYLTVKKILKVVDGKNTRRCPAVWTQIDQACYYLQPYWKLDWSSAQSSCLRLGGNLISLTTNETVEALRTYLASRGDMFPAYMLTDLWIGGFEDMEEGTWSWMNGESVDYENEDENLAWAERELGVTWPHRCLTWSDGLEGAMCDEARHFVCWRDLM